MFLLFLFSCFKKLLTRPMTFVVISEKMWDFISTSSSHAEKLSPSNPNLTISHPCKKYYQISNIQVIAVIAHNTKESPYLFGIPQGLHDFNGFHFWWEGFYTCCIRIWPKYWIPLVKNWHLLSLSQISNFQQQIPSSLFFLKTQRTHQAIHIVKLMLLGYEIDQRMSIGKFLSDSFTLLLSI